MSNMCCLFARKELEEQADILTNDVDDKNSKDHEMDVQSTSL